MIETTQYEVFFRGQQAYLINLDTAEELVALFDGLFLLFYTDPGDRFEVYSDEVGLKAVDLDTGQVYVVDIVGAVHE